MEAESIKRDDASVKRMEEMYWKAFVEFVSPQKKAKTFQEKQKQRLQSDEKERKRSFEYMELSDENPAIETDADSKNSPLKEQYSDSQKTIDFKPVSGYLSPPRCHAFVDADYDAIKPGIMTSSGPNRSGNNNNVETLKTIREAPEEENNEEDIFERNDSRHPAASETWRGEGRLLSLSSDEGQDSSDDDGRRSSQTISSTKGESPSSPPECSWSDIVEHNNNLRSMTSETDHELFDDSTDFVQFVPTLSAIAEEDEVNCSIRTLDGVPAHHSSAYELDEPIMSNDSGCIGRFQDDALSSHSFGSSLRKSSTIENLSMDECEDAEQWQQNPNDTHSLASEERNAPGCSRQLREELEERELGDTDLSNHGSLTDSAYSSHEKLNFMHRSTPDLISTDSSEDLEYCPVSYADSSLKRKRKRWPTFGVGDSRDSLNKISGSTSRFGSFRRKLSRRLSKRERKNKNNIDNCERPSSLPRQTSFRRTIMRVFRNMRSTDHPSTPPENPRPRSWSLPNRNEHTTAIVMATDDSDVVISELAII